MPKKNHWTLFSSKALYHSIVFQVLIIFFISFSSYADTAKITIDPSKTIKPVNKMLFGHGVEAADGDQIFGDTPNIISGLTGGGLWNPISEDLVSEAVNRSKEIGVNSLRYPGGCLVHNFDWKETIGPIGSRIKYDESDTFPKYSFGLDEFLSLCQELSATPIVMVSDYSGTAQDAADLVEYLNMPAGQGYPYADLRANNGHFEPYDVKYFELGNETYHGNHNMVPSEKWSPQEYVAYFEEYATAMKQIDPTIKLGAVANDDVYSSWNPIVFSELKNSMDMAIIHTYVVSTGLIPQDPAVPTDTLLRAALASTVHLEDKVKSYNRIIQDATNKDIPLSITEYNSLILKDDLRFSLAVALLNADYMRLLLSTTTPIEMANYWQYFNSYWGFVRGPNFPSDSQPWFNQSSFYFFRLWHEHFGSMIIESNVESTKIPFEGIFPPIEPLLDNFSPAASVDLTLKNSQEEGCRVTVLQDDEIKIDFESTAEYHHPVLARFDVASSKRYRLTGEIKVTHVTQPFPSTRNIGLGLLDSRGVEDTSSVIFCNDVEYAQEWTPFFLEITTKDDATQLDLFAQLVGDQSVVTSELVFRNIQITPVETLRAHDSLTSISSLSEDGKKLYVMSFNKHHEETIESEIAIHNYKVDSIKAWEVTGPSLGANNVDSEQVSETKSGLDVDFDQDHSFDYTFPPHSMTAFEIDISKTSKFDGGATIEITSYDDTVTAGQNLNVSLNVQGFDFSNRLIILQVRNSADEIAAEIPITNTSMLPSFPVLINSDASSGSDYLILLTSVPTNLDWSQAEYVSSNANITIEAPVISIENYDSVITAGESFNAQIEAPGFNFSQRLFIVQLRHSSGVVIGEQAITSAGQLPNISIPTNSDAIPYNNYFLFITSVPINLDWSQAEYFAGQSNITVNGAQLSITSYDQTVKTGGIFKAQISAPNFDWINNKIYVMVHDGVSEIFGQWVHSQGILNNFLISVGVDVTPGTGHTLSVINFLKSDDSVVHIENSSPDIEIEDGQSTGGPITPIGI